MKISRMLAALGFAAALALGSMASMALAADNPANNPGLTNCLDICSLPSVDPFDAPACDPSGVVAMAACIPSPATINPTSYVGAVPGGGIDPGPLPAHGQFVLPFLKVPAMAGRAFRVHIDPGRITFA